MILSILKREIFELFIEEWCVLNNVFLDLIWHLYRSRVYNRVNIQGWKLINLWWYLRGLFYEDTVKHDDVYDETFINEEPQETPAPIPKKRKKKRTELENLEITLKGWNFATSMYQASPFTVDTIQNNMNAADDYKGGDGGQLRYGENEDADKEFNFVMNVDDFDNMYLL